MESYGRESAVVVLSGGQDSTTCLAWAVRRFKEVHAVTFNYGQRHASELEAAKKAAAYFGPDGEGMKRLVHRAGRRGVVSHQILDMGLLNQLAPNALTRLDIPVRAGENGELPTTFVDGRNLIFLSFAAILTKQLGARYIVTGVSQTDFSGYPDCRDVFIKSLNTTLNLAMDYDFQILTPLMWLTKDQVWELADELDVLEFIRDHTVTCYHGILGQGCGECPACRLRNRGYQEYMKRLYAVELLEERYRDAMITNGESL